MGWLGWYELMKWMYEGTCAGLVVAVAGWWGLWWWCGLETECERERAGVAVVVEAEVEVLADGLRDVAGVVWRLL